MFENVDLSFTPCKSSQWIYPANPETFSAFLVGDESRPVAGISFGGNGRAVAYGDTIFHQLATTNIAHKSLFKQAIQFLSLEIR
ncbi:hypothetical protein ACOZB2_23845 [Pantoea endophytica]